MAVLGFGNEGQIIYRDEGGELVVLASGERVTVGEPDLQMAARLIEAAQTPKLGVRRY